ncbi:arylamine N-acetyltransferase family protein [Paenibacillus pinihumi]|uniref:arylamine N-acetyltransferase family protein n=1 Tax=Paenibacillus pinihumi TaxID=669462 RepID=UPI00040A71F7|nr:arylamine N-acetyltransferase [Paenibacillus pinihumi]
MDALTSQFLHRIGRSGSSITFDELSDVLEAAAWAIPFENISLLAHGTREITLASLMNKIIARREGGLCYELNTLLYFVLLENGFDVQLTRGSVYDHASQHFALSGRTHVTIILTRNDDCYLVDTGFGGNLALRPIPFSGTPVFSYNGEFRVRKAGTEHGDHILELKLKHKDTDWKLGYAFDSKSVLPDLREVNKVQQIIAEHPGSKFNQKPLVTQLTKDGSMTLTESSFTVWKNGEMTKEPVDTETYKQLLGKFGLY